METVATLMTRNPVCSLPDSSLVEVAKLMVSAGCGEIPIINSMEQKHLVGVVTDRDICCRTLGKGLNPMEMKAEDIMTFPVVSISGEASLEECKSLMEENQIRRVPVVDENHCITGIVSLADIVELQKGIAADIVQEVSKPGSASLQ